LHSLALSEYEISRRTKIFPQIHIRQQSAYNIHRILDLLKTLDVRMLSNSNLYFFTSLLTCDKFDTAGNRLYVLKTGYSLETGLSAYQLPF